MSKDLEDSIEKLLRLHRKIAWLPKKRITAQRRQGVKGHLRKTQEARHSNQFRQALSITHHQANQGIYWHGLEHFSSLMSDLTRIKHKEMVWSAKTRKSHPNDQKTKKSQEGSHGMRQTKAKNRSPKTWATALRNRSTKHDPPPRKRQGSNTVMQWQSTGSSRKRQRLNTTDARACKSSNSPKMLNFSQYAQLPISAALNLSTPPG